jgi:uncharacterized membrane protein YeaQ/YmgE (transglycosylase-associated protein family)
MIKPLLVGAVIGAVAGWWMGSGKGGSTIATILQQRGVVR